jgi:transposase
LGCLPNPPTTKWRYPIIMRALDPEVGDAVWAAIAPLLPPPDRTHPLGCHRPRASDRDCFDGMLVRLVAGCSWEDAERLCGHKVSDTTMRTRRDEWIAAGVFDGVVEEALRAYDKIIGLLLSDVSVDGSLHKSPCGGEGTGKNPTDRGKLGWKWSILTDLNGIPFGVAIDGANRNDSVMLAPTLDHAGVRGLLSDIETLWLDRGYDSDVTRERLAERNIDDAIIAKKRKRGASQTKKNQPMGLRWPVERTNSWLSNYGQLRRNTDRKNIHRLAQLSLAIAFLLTAKLIDWRNRWSPAPSPIR